MGPICEIVQERQTDFVVVVHAVVPESCGAHSTSDFFGQMCGRKQQVHISSIVLKWGPGRTPRNMLGSALAFENNEGPEGIELEG